jgi:hypothetical protein
VHYSILTHTTDKARHLLRVADVVDEEFIVARSPNFFKVRCLPGCRIKILQVVHDRQFDVSAKQSVRDM